MLRGATVIDGWSSRPRPDVALLVRDGRIIAMGRRDEIGMPHGTDVLDCTGRWLIPGLVDMHCHVTELFAPHFVAAGVTTVRNTAGSLIALRRLRSAPPDAPTPRVISAGRLIDGPPGIWPGGTSIGIFVAETPEQARTEVRAQAEAGADLIKSYPLMGPDVARAVAEEASAYGLPASCDLIYGTTWNVRDAARFGYRWNEHASGFLQALYPGFSIRDKETHGPIPWEEPDSPALDALCAELVDLGLMLCPTMVLWEQLSTTPSHWEPDNAVVRSARQLLGDHWAPTGEAAAAGRLGAYSRFAAFNQAIARAYRRAGGVVVAGTDTPALCWTWPGYALHRELQILVRNGWSAMAAIQAATSVAATAMGRSDIGVIRPGARADLVLLGADPLADIANTQTIQLVIKGGRSYLPEEPLAHVPSEEALKKLWAAAEEEYARNGR